MFPRKLLRSSAFRLALVFAVLFAGSGSLILAFVYWSTTSYMAQQADETIQAEITGLEERYRLTGLPGLTALIQERLSRMPQGMSIYLLTDSRYNYIAGNLDRWPSAEPGDDGWMTLELTPAGADETHPARAMPFTLAGGYRLLVGRDTYELRAIRTRLFRAMGWGLAFTVALALLGGLAVGRSRIRRIGTINNTITEIMAGDLSQRIPREDAANDIEDLVDKLNGMLDELQTLVEGVKRVSDNIAHDLRTPLVRLKTRLERLRNAHPDDEVEQAIEEADSLLSTFSALLRIARIESGQRRSHFDTIDLTALVDDVAELYGPLIEEAGQKLVLHNAPGVSIPGDRDMLFQTVTNLLENARKHAPHKGSVELSMRPVPGGADIVVADDGSGIPPSERENVLQRFYRLDDARSTPGAGLGLSLVAAVMNLHRGELRFEDNKPGLRVVLRLRDGEGQGPRNPASGLFGDP